MAKSKSVFVPLVLAALSLSVALLVQARQDDSQTTARDPGVRSDAIDAGQPLSTLSPAQIQFFQDGESRFMEVDSVDGEVAGESGKGLGPAFNSNSCASCHAQPAVGGSSPSVADYPNLGPNPQMAAGLDAGAKNEIPYFITADGPVREARFPFLLNASGYPSQFPDGGVHDLFTIAGAGQTLPAATWPSRTSSGCSSSTTSASAYLLHCSARA